MAADGLKAASILRNWGALARHGACLYYVWQAYAKAGAAGQANGTYQTATQGWYASPGKHAGDRNPPAGVPVWWGPRAGNSAGDVVISLGGGRVVATDYPSWGKVGVCTIDQRERQIGRPYFGWTETMLGAPINYTSGSAAGSTEEDDMTPAQEKKLDQAVAYAKEALRYSKAAHTRVTKGLTGTRIAHAVWSAESGVNGRKWGDMLRTLWNGWRMGSKGNWHHGEGTAAVMSEIGAQKIFRAKNGGDPVDVQELAENLAPLLSETEASEFAEAVVRRAGEMLSK